MDEEQMLEEASRRVLVAAEEASHKLACGEILRYLRTNLRKFDNARAGSLELEAFYDWNYAGYHVRAMFHYNGYRHAVTIDLREEEVEKYLSTVAAWKGYLDKQVRIITGELEDLLSQLGYTEIPQNDVNAGGWFEAKGERQPRGAPDAPVGTIFSDMFNQAWVKVTGGWVTKEEHDAVVARKRVPSLADLEREHNRVTAKEQAAAEAAILASMSALGYVPPEEADSPCLSGCRPSEGDVCGGPRCT